MKYLIPFLAQDLDDQNLELDEIFNELNVLPVLINNQERMDESDNQERMDESEFNAKVWEGDGGELDSVSLAE